MIKRTVLLATVLLYSGAVQAQMDPQFTSNMFNLLTSNPGKAGSTGRMNAVGLTRNQWVNYGASSSNVATSTAYKVVNPTTYVASLDANVKILKQESGVGITFIEENLGLVNNLSINFIYSYRKKLWNGTLGIGLAAGIINNTWNGDQIYIPEGDWIDDISYLDEYSSIESQLGNEFIDTKFDMSLGTFFENEKFYAGVSATHLFRPELEVSEESGYYLFFNRNYYISGGYKHQLEANPKFELIPSLFFKTDGITFQTDLNCNVWYDNTYYGGLTYRLQDGIAFLLGAKLRNGLMVGYAFDLTTSRLNYGTYGSHEIVIGYAFDLSASKQKSKYKSIRIL